MENKIYKTVDEYIKSFPEDTQMVLSQIRQTIKKTAPDAVEMIAYRMPAYKLNGKPLAYFAAFEHHIGFYPLPHTINTFKADLAKYKQGKGSIQFPLNGPMPFELIERIVKFRAEESMGDGKN
jgi:uncharacterized protein YdhG (YjbR/CyaY superfamily)